MSRQKSRTLFPERSLAAGGSPEGSVQILPLHHSDGPAG
jgi:hypothetical protein